MKKKVVPVMAAVVLIGIVVAISIISKIVESYTPSDEVMASQEYFGVSGDKELALIFQNQLVPYKGFIDNDKPYLDYRAVKEHLNSRFYWDSEANLMVYTTPMDIIHIPAGENRYTVSGKTETVDYDIVKVDGSDVYVAAAFVQLYTNMDFQLLKEPNHLIVTYQWGDVNYANVKKADSVRYQGGIKSPILTNVAKGAKVTVLEQMDVWSKIMTPDGYIGYIENKKLGTPYVETTKRDFDEPVYTSNKKDYKINLVWHVISNEEANYNLLNDIANMKGVNTISPTWFSISSNSGEIRSLASEDYVAKAHAQNLAVWALVDNFDEQIDTTKVLTSTASREKLSNQLIAAAVQYSLDGINVDFEALPESAGEGYIQFIRELSVKCRKNGIVLSIDDPVPMPYTAFYNRKEQGIVADYVIVMGYDEHYVGSEQAGSVASLPFVRAGIEETLKEVPADKIISGVPFYTRLWMTDKDGVLTSEAKGMDTAEQWLRDNSLAANWSQETSQDYAEMEDLEGTKYQIWLENEKSLEEKAKLVKEFNLGGIAAWRLGLERPAIWDVLYRYVG